MAWCLITKNTRTYIEQVSAEKTAMRLYSAAGARLEISHSQNTFMFPRPSLLLVFLHE
jgi:hypothetical protein